MAQITLEKRNTQVKPKVFHVFTRKLQRIGRNIGCNNTAFGALICKRACNAAASRANVGCQKRLICRQGSKCFTDQHFCLWTWNQNAFAHLHVDMSESYFAHDVLKRLTRTATRHVFAQHIALGMRKRLVVIGVNLHTRQTCNRRKEPLCGQARVRISLALQVPLGPFQRCAYRPQIGHRQPPYIKNGKPPFRDFPE